MANSAGVTAVDHIGFSVASLDDAIQFLTEAMGFALARQCETGGDFLRKVTGVGDPRCRVAMLTSPNGFPVELLEYSTGRELGRVPDSAGAIGATHLAVTVTDIRRAIARVETAGWHVKGPPQLISGGPLAGTLVACHRSG